MNLSLHFYFCVSAQFLFKAYLKLLLIRFVDSINVFPINVDSFYIFMLVLFALLAEERTLKPTIDDVDHGFYSKKLWKVIYFHHADRSLDILSLFDSFHDCSQILVIHLSSQLKVFLAMDTVSFVLFLYLIMHVIVLLHDLFDQMGRGSQKYIPLFKYFVEI